MRYNVRATPAPSQFAMQPMHPLDWHAPWHRALSAQSHATGYAQRRAPRAQHSTTTRCSYVKHITIPCVPAHRQVLPNLTHLMALDFNTNHKVLYLTKYHGIVLFSHLFLLTGRSCPTSRTSSPWTSTPPWGTSAGPCPPVTSSPPARPSPTSSPTTAAAPPPCITPTNYMPYSLKSYEERPRTCCRARPATPSTCAWMAGWWPCRMCRR